MFLFFLMTTERFQWSSDIHPKQKQTVLTNLRTKRRQRKLFCQQLAQLRAKTTHRAEQLWNLLQSLNKQKTNIGKAKWNHTNKEVKYTAALIVEIQTRLRCLADEIPYKHTQGGSASPISISHESVFFEHTNELKKMIEQLQQMELIILQNN